MIFISASFPCAALVHVNRSIRLLGLEGWSKLIVFQIGALAFAGMQLNAIWDPRNLHGGISLLARERQYAAYFMRWRVVRWRFMRYGAAPSAHSKSC
jgi:hypothetical protein